MAGWGSERGPRTRARTRTRTRPVGELAHFNRLKVDFNLCLIWFHSIRAQAAQQATFGGGWFQYPCTNCVSIPRFHPSAHREPLSPMTWAWACRQDYNSSCLFWTVIRINSARLVPAPNQCKYPRTRIPIENMEMGWWDAGMRPRVHRSTGRVPTHSHLTVSRKSATTNALGW